MAEDRVALEDEARGAPAALDRRLGEGERRRHRVDPAQQEVDAVGIDAVLRRHRVQPLLLLGGERVPGGELGVHHEKLGAPLLHALVRFEHERQHETEEHVLAVGRLLHVGEPGRNAGEEDARHRRSAAPHRVQVVADRGEVPAQRQRRVEGEQRARLPHAEMRPLEDRAEVRPHGGEKGRSRPDGNGPCRRKNHRPRTRGFRETNPSHCRCKPHYLAPLRSAAPTAPICRSRGPRRPPECNV